MKRFLRIIGLFLLIAVILIGIFSVAVVVSANAKFDQTYDLYPVDELELPTDAEFIATEGARLYRTRGCADCHGDDGGGGMFNDDAFIGRLFTANLTSGAGGIGANYDTDDWVRAIQHGIKPDGTSLWIMPSADYITMHRDEMATLIAYIQSLEPVNNNLPDNGLGPFGYLLFVSDAIPLQAELINHEAVQLSDMPIEPSAEYGATLATMCTGCHTQNFAGGQLSGTDIIVPNITAHEADGIGSYSLDDFVNLMLTGTLPNGNLVDRTRMPWETFREMNPTEIQALYIFLQQTEPLPDPPVETVEQ